MVTIVETNGVVKQEKGKRKKLSHGPTILFDGVICHRYIYPKP